MERYWLRKTGFAAAGLVGLALALGATGCKSNTGAPIVDSTTTDATDPADVNMAPVNGAVPVYTSQQPPAKALGQRAESPQQQPPVGETYPEQQAGGYDQAYDQDQDAVDAGQQALYAEQAPPPLPEYQQPELSEPGYEWTPGYWSYAQTGYYWVPGVWVAPPFVGALWTPGYWGSYSGRYRFHHGFWGSHIGFYGGINYGYGYTGSGYHGGYWQGNNFYYNRQVNRVNVNVVRNVYEHNVTVVNNTRYSFNGPQGVNARPSAVDVAVYHEHVVPAMQVQVQHAREAEGNRQQFYSVNQGRPAAAVVTQRLAADRNPPPAIRPAPEVRQQMQPQPANGGRPGVVNQPAGNGRPEQGQPVRGQQDQRLQQEQQVRDQQTRDQQIRQQQVQPQRQPQPQPQQQGRPGPQPQQQGRPPQETRPQAQPQPQQRAQPQLPGRPDQPQGRPMQEARPQPQPQQRPPQPQLQQRPEPQPQQQQRQPRPQPQARPQPQPQPQQQPRQETRPQPQPPQPQRQAPPPQQQPARPPQEAHPAPPPQPVGAPRPVARPEPPRDEHPKQ